MPSISGCSYETKSTRNSGNCFSIGVHDRHPWSLLRRERADETRRELDPAGERAAAAVRLVDPDEAAHPAPAEDDGLGAGFCQRPGFQFLANPEHEAADFDAAQHVAVQHPA